MKRINLLLLLFVLALPHLKAQPQGDYEGAITILGNNLGIKMHLGNEPFGGTLDVPVQGAYNLAFKEARYMEDSLYLLVDTGMTRFSFSGKYFPEGDSLSGTFKQGSYVGSFHVAPPEAEKISWVNREVTFKNEGITLAGTLSVPDTTNTHPAVILISGSGQQDRDENVYGFKVLKTLARLFIEQGYAVLRYDDRGTGKTDKGDLENATSKTFAGDVAAAHAFLSGHKRVAAGKIGLMGHSEGGIIAGMVARRINPAFVILMASPAVPGDSLLLAQSRAIMQAMGKSPKAVRAAASANRKLYKAVQQQNPNWKQVESQLHAALEKATPDSLRASLPQQVNAQMQALKSAWFRFFLGYDPAPDLAALSCPVLALFGQKDTQVPPEQNMEALRNIIDRHDKTNYQIRSVDQANHLFQKAETGAPTEYMKLDKAFAEDFEQAIAQWLQSLKL